MPKKSVSIVNSEDSRKIQEAIVQNLIELQKVHAGLLEKFDKLSVQLTNLLALFETAAKSYSENNLNKVSEKDKEFLEKIDKLLEQNKVLAKGLTLIEDRTRQKIYGQQGFPVQNQTANIKDNLEDYSPSYINKPLPKI